jgi:hypothetical protein
MANENGELKRLETFDLNSGFRVVMKRCSKHPTTCISSVMTSELDLEYSYSADPAAK